jgi:hypothetical protein
MGTVSVALVTICESEFVQVHTAVASALKRIVVTCVSEQDINLAVEMLEPLSRAAVAPHSLHEILNALLSLLQLRYQNAWIYTLDSIRTMFKKLSEAHEGWKLLSQLLTSLAELYSLTSRENVTMVAGVLTSLEDTIGEAICTCGVENFLQILPIDPLMQSQVDGLNSLEGNVWLIPILREYLKVRNSLYILFRMPIYALLQYFH